MIEDQARKNISKPTATNQPENTPRNMDVKMILYIHVLVNNSIDTDLLSFIHNIKSVELLANVLAALS